MTTTITPQQVRDIAELAKLHLTDAEVALYAAQLGSLLAHFEALQQLDTSDVPPTASVLPPSNIQRPDVPAAPLTPQQVIANAPDAEDNMFRVDTVLPGGE